MTSCFSAGQTVQSELPGVPGTQQCWSRKSSGFHICICLLQEKKRIRDNYFVQIILEVQQRRDLIRFYSVHFFHMQTFPLVQFLTLLSHSNFSSRTEAAALDPLLEFNTTDSLFCVTHWAPVFHRSTATQVEVLLCRILSYNSSTLPKMTQNF